MRKIILASASPRRRELLAQAGIPFEVMPSGVEEHITGTDPKDVVRELSEIKCSDIAGRLDADESFRDSVVVLGADTVVVLDNAILGKPDGTAGAIAMIRSLQGRTHAVYTGVTMKMLTDGRLTEEISFAVETKVTVFPMTEEEIREYAATGEPLDKAGAYGIQGGFCRYIEKIDGDYYNVVGLPVSAVYRQLKKWNVK